MCGPPLSNFSFETRSSNFCCSVISTLKVGGGSFRPLSGSAGAGCVSPWRILSSETGRWRTPSSLTEDGEGCGEIVEEPSAAEGCWAIATLALSIARLTISARAVGLMQKLDSNDALSVLGCHDCRIWTNLDRCL